MRRDRPTAAPRDRIDSKRLIRLACDIVRIPSPTGSEGRVAEYLASFLDRAGLSIELQAVEGPLSAEELVAAEEPVTAEIYASTTRELLRE